MGHVVMISALLQVVGAGENLLPKPIFALLVIKLINHV